VRASVSGKSPGFGIAGCPAGRGSDHSRLATPISDNRIRLTVVSAQRRVSARPTAAAVR
jgi:hypothetical protein